MKRPRAKPALPGFLSYNRADQPIAQEIAKFLRSNGCDVWLDEWELCAGDSITDKIQDAVARARYFILLMSPESMKSRWVKQELRVAFTRRVDDDLRIIPVRLRPCRVPTFLKDTKHLDYSEGIGFYNTLLAGIYGTFTSPPVLRGFVPDPVALGVEMKGKRVMYLLLDGRAEYDPDRAVVLSVHDTLAEALEMKYSGSFGLCYIFAADVEGRRKLGNWYLIG